jgi:hypothetical protein
VGCARLAITQRSGLAGKDTEGFFSTGFEGKIQREAVGRRELQSCGLIAMQAQTAFKTYPCKKYFY